MDSDPAPRSSPEDVFKDFMARRAGILKALTTDVEKFFQECDPEKEDLSLIGLPDGNWKVGLLDGYLPPALPEPVVGINFARKMPRKDWLELVALHSDVWLLSVSFHIGALGGLDKNSRMELFDLINDLPTIYQIVTGPRTENKEQHKKRHSNASSKVNKSTPIASKPSKVSRAASLTQKKEEDVEDMDIGEGAGDLCGICGRGENSNEEFWIGCDECSRWFHVQCVRYKCHKCYNNKLARRSTMK